jgi:uncharacterized protein
VVQKMAIKNTSASEQELPKEWIISRFIAMIKQNFPQLAASYKIKSLAVFGSYVHNAQRQGSDLDLLVEFYEAPSLFEFLALEDALTDLLGVKVDLVMRETLKPGIGKYILQEARPV